MVHILSGLAKRRFCIPRTRCEPYGPHSFRLANPKFCIPRTRCETYGPHLLPVCTTQDSHLVLGLQKAVLANPTRVRTIGFASRSGKAKPRFRQPRMSVDHGVRISFWECKTQLSPTQNECAASGSHLILGIQNSGVANTE